MPIKLNGATSGSVELNVPAAVSGGDVALTLPNGVGSANQFLKNGSTPGALEFAGLGDLERVKRTYSAEVSVSNGDSEVEFTGIPADVSNLRLVFQDLGLSGSNNVIVQVGYPANGGTYYTSGYESTSAKLSSSSNTTIGSTSGLVIYFASPNNEISGILELYPNKISDPDVFLSNSSFTRVNGTQGRFGAGITPDVGLVTIDRIRIIPDGGNTFNSTNGAKVTLVTEVIE